MLAYSRNGLISMRYLAKSAANINTSYSINGSVNQRLSCSVWKKLELFDTLRPFKAAFHFNRTVAKRSVSYIMSISLVLPECSRNNEIRYVSLRYG